MAPPHDPYALLGVARGSSLEEIKRAYRRLAKANHPDAAGAAALPRFLAIQAAYEQLAGTAAPPVAGRSARARRPWDADQQRADSTRRAYGGRRRPDSAGAKRERPQPKSGAPGEARTAGQPGSAEGEASRTRRGRGKATLGSTSYDDADAGQFEPDWGGASWYGTTSGTYWTINPKEYADPRKHGPEYQARARRAAEARAARSARARQTQATPPPAPEWRSSEEATRFSTVDDAPAAADAMGGRASAAPSAPPAAPPATAPLDVTTGLGTLARLLTDARAGGVRARAVRAVAGWLPIALGLGWIVGELSGCGRFAATCDPSVGPLTTAGQGVILAALFLLPEIAAIAAGAATVVLVAAVAASVIISATGAAADEPSRRAALASLLVVAWVCGLAVAIVRRLRASPPDTRPVS